jgi:uroporphyrin-III C-methyltransferase/precorrin-2 dehydrogenase/sirohydrochlorin ferrochelatase
LRCAGLLVNVVDRPDLCDFTVPSILERGPVTISVGTGGVSAGFAKALRLRLESLLPPALGDLASALGAARDAMKARWPDPRSRRQAMDAALAPGGALDLMNAQSASRIAQFIEEGADPAAGDRTVEIALQSGDPDDLTIAQARLMGSADTIVHDEKVPLAVLNRARADAIRLPARDDIPVRPGLTIRLTYP